MSSRWKKRKDKKRRNGSGWVSMNSLTADDVREGAALAVQQSSCQVSGEVFVRPITGRFKGLPEKKLRKMLDEMAGVFAWVGHTPVVDPGQPLWIQVEFLDNLLDFELNPPCGCESELKKRLKSA